MEERRSRLELARDWYLQEVDAVPDNRWRDPSLCSEWSVANVVAHVASGDQLFRARILEAAGTDRTGLDLPVDQADRQRRFQAISAAEPAEIKSSAHRAAEAVVPLILETLEKNPQLVVSVPYGEVPMNVVRSLRLNEYIIHGHDLTPAIPGPRPVPEWFVERALGDAITMMTRLHGRSPHKGKRARFHIHRTDGEGEWTLVAHDGEALTEAGHSRGDVAFRGPGESLYWVLMGRGRPHEIGVEVFGEPELAAAFKEWFPGP